MNTDIRLSIEFWDHPKTVKLERRLGFQGVKSLQILWMWAAKNRPDGDLSSLDEEDIEIAARWDGENGALYATLVDLAWIDVVDDEVFLHDWADHNSWVAESTNRSDAARLSRLARENPEAAKALREEGRLGISEEEYRTLKYRSNYDRSTTVEETYNERTTNVERPSTIRSTPAPAPAPAPEPEPKEKENGQQSGAEGASPSSRTDSLPESRTPSSCPHKAIVALFGEVLPELPQPKTWGTDRQKNLRARWNEDPARQDLDWWRELFRSVREAPFLMGGNDRGWRLSLDWLIRPTNFAKVLDRKYGGAERGCRGTPAISFRSRDPDEILAAHFHRGRGDPS